MKFHRNKEFAFYHGDKCEALKNQIKDNANEIRILTYKAQVAKSALWTTRYELHDDFQKVLALKFYYREQTELKLITGSLEELIKLQTRLRKLYTAEYKKAARRHFANKG